MDLYNLAVDNEQKNFIEFENQKPLSIDPNGFYIGETSENKHIREGYGKQYWIGNNQNVYYEGSWKNNCPNNSGILIKAIII